MSITKPEKLETFKINLNDSSMVECTYICPSCGEDVLDKTDTYCPYCGIKIKFVKSNSRKMSKVIKATEYEVDPNLPAESEFLYGCPNCEETCLHLYDEYCCTCGAKIKFLTLDKKIPKAIIGFKGNYRFLSNFYPSKIKLDKLIYPTAEHAYQAAKSINPGIRKRIARLDTPTAARELGRHIKLRKDWNNKKLDVMIRILEKKFTHNRDLSRKLVSTSNMLLVEENTWHDNYWGVCSCLRCRRNGNLGLNHLGNLLMMIREQTLGETK